LAQTATQYETTKIQNITTYKHRYRILQQTTP